MMQDLSGKRLLILGGTNNANDIERFAVQHKVVLISAGTYLSKALQDIVAEAYTIDILDRSQLKALVLEKKIDGIFVGGNEDIISVTIDVCEELGLPFYASRAVWDRAMNKRIFKKTCRENGVPTMEDYEIDESDLCAAAAALSYPVVIKPVDCCGSQGVMKCERAEDFPALYQNAKQCSKTNSATVEEFNDGFEICVYYTFVDGKPTLSSMADKYVRGNSESFIPLSEIYAYPSQYLPQYIEQVDEQMKKMLLALGVRNGITSMQGFYKDGGFKFFEMGFRLGGTAQYRYTEHLNGINSLHMMMALALTGKMGDCDQSSDTAQFRKPCCTLTLLSKGGTVARIEGLEEARKLEGVLHIENRYKVGDTIRASRTVSQFHVRIFIVADSEEQMKQKIEHLQTSIQAYDTEGEPMLITHFDTNKLSFGQNQFS